MIYTDIRFTYMCMTKVISETFSTDIRFTNTVNVIPGRLNTDIRLTNIINVISGRLNTDIRITFFTDIRLTNTVFTNMINMISEKC